MRTRRRSPLTLVIALAVTASACTGGRGEPAASDARRKVAFFQDLSIEDPLDLVSPSFLALEAGLAQAAEDGTIGVPIPVQFDTGGDPFAALESARTVAADDAYVAVVAAPFWTMPEDVAEAFAGAGLPVLSLSDGQRPTAPGLVWRRFVAPAPAQANELAARAEAATTGTICIVPDDSATAKDLAAAVGERLGERAVARTQAGLASCDAVVWTGGPSGAAALRISLAAETPFLVADTAKAAAYLDEAIPASDGTVAVCPCVEVTTATDLRARRFVNAYQAATGLAPGVFAAEGWDIASLLAGIAGGAPEADRAAFLVGVDAVTGAPGVGGPIAFDAQGEPLGATGVAHASEAAGLRWLPLG